MRNTHRPITGLMLALALTGCGHAHVTGPALHGVAGNGSAPVVEPGTPGSYPADPGSPGTPGGGMAGISVFFTAAYKGVQAGESSPQALSANAAASQANPNNPDRQLCALIDAAPAGSTLHGAFFDIQVADVVDSFIKAKARGVDVSLVTENDYYVDSSGAIRAPISKLKAGGIPVRPDDRKGLMHDKFLVLNRKTVWTGSYNITDGGSYHDNNNALRIDSPALANIYEQEFQKMAAGDFGAGNHPAPQAVNVNGVLMTPYFSPNRPGEGGPKAAILAELNAAQRSIQFMAFSFTDTDFEAAMAHKAQAGLQVAGSFDHSESSSQYSAYHKLAAVTGIDVRVSTNPALMHHKVMIIDGSTVITGSFNFSKNAQESNNENMLVIKNAPALVASFNAEFTRVMSTSNASGSGLAAPTTGRGTAVGTSGNKKTRK
jgi:HKD family nuclease